MNDLGKGFQIGCGILAAVVGIPILLCSGLFITGDQLRRAREEKEAETVKPIDHSDAVQKKRLEVFRGTLERQIFTKVEDRGGGLVRLWTGPAFDGLDFDAKQTFTSVVFAYHFDGLTDSEFIVLHDGRTGKQIGRFTKHGLAMN